MNANKPVCFNYEEFTHLQERFAAVAKERDEVKSELSDCRNELCLRCGLYKNEHHGACDGCRWHHQYRKEI